jgi:hypothetical protein
MMSRFDVLMDSYCGILQWNAFMACIMKQLLLTLGSVLQLR